MAMTKSKYLPMNYFTSNQFNFLSIFLSLLIHLSVDSVLLYHGEHGTEIQMSGTRVVLKHYT